MARAAAPTVRGGEDGVPVPREPAPLLDGVAVEQVALPPKGVEPAAARAMLDACIDAVDGGMLDHEDELLERLRETAKQHDAKVGAAFRVLYVAVLGEPAGVPVIQAMAFLGKERALERLRTARTRLG